MKQCVVNIKYILCIYSIYVCRIRQQNRLISNAIQTVADIEEEGEDILYNLNSNKEMIKSSMEKVHEMYMYVYVDIVWVLYVHVLFVNMVVYNDMLILMVPKLSYMHVTDVFML